MKSVLLSRTESGTSNKEGQALNERILSNMSKTSLSQMEGKHHAAKLVTKDSKNRKSIKGVTRLIDNETP